MSLGTKTISGILWTSAGEIIVKFISPVSFLVLASILSPSDFGIVAIATTVLSFVNIISDLGTGKVLVQLKCQREQFSKYCTTAFWFNIIMGICLFFLIFGFSDFIAKYNNQPEAALVVKVMSIQILFTSLSTVQVAIMNRNMNFKALFYIRLITVAVPALVSIPIAFLGGGLWAIVFGNLFGSLFHLLAIWWYSTWKPSFLFDKFLLYNIFSKSLWSTLQQISVWIPIAFDTYLISNYISTSSLGIYTTARQLFHSVSLLVRGPVLTVIFSSLSKIDDDKKFKQSVLFAQKFLFSVSSFIGIFVFIYSDFITKILFSDQWNSISDVLAIIFLLMGIETFYSIIVEALRARGYFKELALNNLISVIISLPFLLYSSHMGLLPYTIVRCLTLYICYVGVFYYSGRNLNISFLDCLKNSSLMLFSITVLIMSVFIASVFNQINYSLLISVIFILTISIFIYKEKNSIMTLINMLIRKK